MPRRVTPAPRPNNASLSGSRWRPRQPGPECAARVWWPGDRLFVKRQPPGAAVVGGPSRCFGFKGQGVRAIMPLMALPSRPGLAACPAACVGEADLRRDSNGARRAFTPCHSPSGRKVQVGGAARAWGACGRVSGYGRWEIWEGAPLFHGWAQNESKWDNKSARDARR